jgi:hypothetical protein
LSIVEVHTLDLGSGIAVSTIKYCIESLYSFVLESNSVSSQQSMEKGLTGLLF